MTRRALLVALGGAVWLTVTALRFLSTIGFTDDHYVHLAGAQQITFGEWPSRDFVDIGAPLQFALSAVAMTIGGPSLASEALLVAALFGLAAVLTLKAALDLTGSVVLALAAVTIEVAVFPRSYSYPKLLTFAAGILAMWRYAAQPTLGRLVQLAGVVVVAFLLRHDHGVYLGLGGAVAVALAAAPSGPRAALVRLATYVGVGMALVSPYMVYLALYGGVWSHVSAGMAVSSVEGSRSLGALPGFTRESWSANAVPLLFYSFYVLPVIAVVATPRERMAWIAPLAALALLVDFGFMRETLSVRIPDVIVPASLLLVWTVALAWRSRPVAAGIAARGAAIVLLLGVAMGAVVVGAAREQLDRAGLFGGLDRLPERLSERAAQLGDRLAPGQVPSASAFALLPFFTYADRCLGPADHVLVPQFMPEIAMWARQPFAGGQIWFQPGILASERDHRLVLERLGRQRVPVAVIEPAGFSLIAAGFPELGRYVRRLTETRTLDVQDRGPIEVRFDPAMATSRDESTGWPCYQ